MQPIPETTEAVNEYGPFWPHGDLLDRLQDMAARVREIVPECVGLSLASIEHGVTFTLVASDEEIAALDAVQYLDGGPCVEAVKGERVLQFTQDEFLESDWHQFALATAASGVASTLTLPVLVEGEVSGSVNLYGATPDAFTAHHEAIADIFGAWAPAAVANADLSFATRDTAEQAPTILHDGIRLQVAVGMIMVAQEIDEETARERLLSAAQRARVSPTELAKKVIESATSEDQIDD